MHTLPFDTGIAYVPDTQPAAILIDICSSERADTAALRSQLPNDVLLALFPVRDWNAELSPWIAEAVFGTESFSGGGRETLLRLTKAVSSLSASFCSLPVFLCGYSLGGLFALWAMHESNLFAGCAAVSGSFWFPGLVDYVRSSPLPSDVRIYLSLGKKESKSRNRQLRTVGETLNELFEYYSECCTCTLEWNEGNHFTDPQGRMLRGINWLYLHKENTPDEGCVFLFWMLSRRT